MDKPQRILMIQELWARRRRWHKAEKSLTLQMKAACRRLCTPDGKGNDEDGLQIAKEEGDKLFAAVVNDKPHRLAAEGKLWLTPLLNARNVIEASRTEIEKLLSKSVRDLPVYEWAHDIRGVGDITLAGIVGECGELSQYTVPQLWKRLGLAVMPDGRCQRRISDREQAILAGYSPERRSVIWNMGDTIIKAQIRKPPVENITAGRMTAADRISLGKQGQMYLDRKAYEAARAEELGLSKLHIHNRAKRYMEKKFIKNLWSAWRRADHNAAENFVLGAI